MTYSHTEWWARVFLCLFVALSLSGCGDSKPAPLTGMGTSADSTDSAAPAGTDAALPFAWPPELHKAFPDLELVDQTGARIKLSSFKGKVILLEPIGMTCPGCQAFVGAAEHGSFKGVQPQANLPSIKKGMADYGGASLDDPRIVYVHLLLYDMKMKAPSAEDAKAWAEHFKMDRAKNQIVLAADPAMLGNASFKMIPGFYLIDKDFVLQSDSTGHHPRDSLWEKLIPLSKELVADVP